MKYIGKVLGWLLLGVNVLCALTMLFCAYSSYINPVTHPVLSCSGLAFPVMLIVNILFLCFWLIIYRKYALLPAVAILCCAQAIWICCPLNCFQKEVPEGSLKLLSYNVMAFNMDKPHTKENPNEIIEYLQHSDADIICLQEYITGARLKKKEIDCALSAYPYKHFYKIANGINGLGCYSRYPILSATPASYPSKANGSIVYTIKVKDDMLTVINNHLESNKLTLDDRAIYMEIIKDPEAGKVKEGSKKLINKLADAVPIRAAQADTIAQLIRHRTTPSVIVCGDFNTSPFSYAHRIIAHGLRDAFVQSGCGLGISYNKNGFYFRIDQILISPDLRSYRCTVDKSIKHSDHYPIWCYISKKTSK